MLGNDEYVLQDFSGISLRQGDSFLKSYMRGDSLVHAHFTLESRESVNHSLYDYCAVFERPCWELLMRQHLKGAERIQKIKIPNGMANEIEVAVLVDIIEVLKNPKGMEKGVWPVVVRLQPLDDCLSRCINKADFVKSASTRWPAASTDRAQELGVLPVNRELEMVKRRAKVVDYLANQHAEEWRRVLVDLDGDREVVVSVPFRIELSAESLRVRVQETPHFLVKGIQLFACPLKWDVDVLKRWWPHTLHLAYEQGWEDAVTDTEDPEGSRDTHSERAADLSEERLTQAVKNGVRQARTSE